MQRQTAPGLCLAAALAIAVTASPAPTALAQGGAEVSLFDGKSLAGWDQLGTANWRVEDGAIVADNKVDKPQNYLVSKQSFKNFVLHVEFWASNEANSGVHIRCSDPKKVSDHTCYEINIFDQRPDPTYGTGSITHYVEINPMPKAGGKWNTFDITAKGRQISVMMNGQKTVELHNNMWPEGVIALQHGGGTIKYRKVTLKPL